MSRPARRRAVLAAGVATLFAGSVALVPATAPPTRHTLTGSTRTQVALNGGWRFLRADAPGAQAVGFDDSAWTPVTVPHTWNACDGQDGGDDYYRGAGWYRRRYTPPAGWAGKRLWLQFDGANTVTDVWVNGRHLGRHRGGYAGPHRRDGRRPQQRHPAARRDGVHPSWVTPRSAPPRTPSNRAPRAQWSTASPSPRPGCGADAPTRTCTPPPSWLATPPSSRPALD